MILDWFAVGGVLGIALGLLFVPGILIATAAGVRGFRVIAIGPALSTGLFALLAMAYPFLGIRWSRLSAAAGVLALVLAVGLVCAGFRRLRGSRVSSIPLLRSPAQARHGVLIAITGIIVGMLLTAARLMMYIGDPTAISQSNDAVFHLNALRWIFETGSASSLQLSGLIGSHTFYPAAWHAIASLVAGDTAGVPVAVNMLSLAIAAVVWPLGIAYFTSVITRGNRFSTGLAGALAGVLPAFPQLMFEWGVLFPYALSVAILPAVIGVSFEALRAFPARRDETMRGWPVALVLASLVGGTGIALAQPSTLLVWILMVLLWATAVLIRRRRTIALWPVVVAATGWALLVVLWAAMAYLAGPVLWKPYRSVPGAMLDVISNAPSLLPALWGVSILMLLGLFAALREAPLRWLAAGWLLLSALYILGVAIDLPLIKRAVTGPWYGDSFRLAALTPLVAVPLSAIGVRFVVDMITRRVRRDLGAALSAAVLLVVVAVTAIGLAVRPVVQLRVAADTDSQTRYSMNQRSYLSTDEYELIRRLPTLIPDDALIIANPSTGAAFAYALGDRDIVPRTWSPPDTAAWWTLADHLRDAQDLPGVCEALAAYGSPGYVLDFGIGGTRPGEYRMPGMTGFTGHPGFTRVAAVGRASLWRIDACR